MKYIRTKDELGILVESNKDIKDKYGYYLKKGCYFKTWFSPNINREDIIKEADTIEELCDEFVVYIDELKSPSQFREWHLAKKYKNVFGVIWTDKGLIYVAKMNEKGTLELL